LDPNLLRIIKGVGSQDPYIAMASVNEIRDIVESPEKQAVMRDYEEMFIQSVLLQFKVCKNLIILLHCFHKFGFVFVSVEPLSQTCERVVGPLPVGVTQHLFPVQLFHEFG
jgi:hypothetical protein